MLPTAYSPFFGSFKPKVLASVWKKESGRASNIPAPSPVFSSNPHPPRWSILELIR